MPAFALYGETSRPDVEDLHIEDIQSRSKLYRWEIEPHVHRGLHQILWVAEGAAEVALDEWRGTAEGPAAIVVPPGIVHGFRFAPHTDGFVLTLGSRFLVEGEAAQLAGAVRALFAAPRVAPFAAGGEAAARIGSLVRELAAEFAAPAGTGTPVPGWLARAVLWRLAGAVEREAGGGLRAQRHQALFTRFVVLVEQHYREHWPLPRYGSRLGVSPARLNRLVKAETGRGAMEWIHDRLTREACRRLVYIAAPVASLAAELGFADPAYFSRYFKRRTGATPAAWRARHT